MKSIAILVAVATISVQRVLGATISIPKRQQQYIESIIEVSSMPYQLIALNHTGPSKTSPPFTSPTLLTFRFYDDRSVVSDGTCTFPKITSGDIPFVPEGVAQPCQPPTFQYQIENWQNLGSFDIHVMHT